MKEIWKDVEGYDGDYLISNLGKVKSLKNKNPKKILKPSINNRGYYYVNLCKKNIQKNFYIHRLVGKAFITNPENKPEINHKNGIKTDNHVTNLEWATPSENVQHAYKMGLCEITRKATKKNIIIAQEARKKSIYSKDLDLKFESLTEAAIYIQSIYFENSKLEYLIIYIFKLLKNKTTKSKYDFGWSYISK